MLKKLFSLLYPSGYSCICCNRDIFDSSNFFCDKCEDALPFLNKKLCLRCSEPLVSDGNYCKRCKGKKFYYDLAISPFVYKDCIKKFIMSNINKILQKLLQPSCGGME